MFVLTSILTIIFAVLKGMGYLATWSWWFVFAPTLGYLAFLLLMLILGCLGMAGLSWWVNKK